MVRLVRGLVAAWLLLLAGAHLVALCLVWWIFVRTPHGQVLDGAVLRASTLGRTQVEGLATTVLNAVSLASLAAATIAIGFVALARRRYRLAIVATLLVVGANATSQLMKHVVIVRPDFDIAGTNIGAPNSMPSGHVTVAAALAVAAVLVVPTRMSGLTAILGAAYGALTCVATLSVGWHRPSDGLASLLIVGAWASGGAYLLMLAQSKEPVREPARPQYRTVAILALVGAALLVVAILAIGFTHDGQLTPPVDLGRRELVGAYVGGVTTVAGSTCLLMAVVLSTVHRVVPRLDQPSLVESVAETQMATRT